MSKHAIQTKTSKQLFSKAIGFAAATALSISGIIALNGPAANAVGCDSALTAIPTASNTVGFGGGLGTALDPWQICSRTQLEGIDANAATLDGNYLLAIDLNLLGSSSANQWTPLGGFFTGTLDGGFNAITGIYVDGARTNYGLFEIVDNTSVVKNLSLSGTISADAYAGSDRFGGLLAGKANRSTIENILVTSVTLTGGVNYQGGLVGKGSFVSMNQIVVSNATITPPAITSGQYAGGLVGYLADSGTVTRIQTSGNIDAQNSYNNTSYERGGIIGNALRVDISQASSSMTIANDSGGDGYSGGLLGSLSSDSKVSNSRYLGQVGGSFRSGGAFGFMSDRTTATNSLMVTTVGAATFRGPWDGGFYGTSVTGSFFDMDVFGTSYTPGTIQNNAIAQTTANLKLKSTFDVESWSIAEAGTAAVTTSWSLTDSSDPIWKIEDGASYPELVWLDFFDNLFMQLSYTPDSVMMYPGQQTVATINSPFGSPATSYSIVNGSAPFAIDSSTGTISDDGAVAGQSYNLQISAAQSSLGLTANIYLPVTVSDGILPSSSSTLAPATGPASGEAIWASAFERELPAAITTNASVLEEYVYRITTAENDETTLVDSQSETGYTALTTDEQETWYQNMGGSYTFSWNAFVCLSGNEVSLPSSVEVDYFTIEGMFDPTPFGVNADNNVDLRKIASLLGAGQPKTLAATGLQSSIVQGTWDNNNAVTGVSEVSGSCAAPATFTGLAIVDAFGNAINQKSLDTSRLFVDVAGTPIAIDPAGVSVGVTGGSSGAAFNAALFGLTTIQAALPTGAAPYVGPVVASVNNAIPGETTTVQGRTLLGVTKVEIDGYTILVTPTSDSSFSFIFPAGITSGTKDLKIFSSYGVLTVQDAFTVTATGTESATAVRSQWTKLLPDGKTVKMYAKDPIGDGKIQFFVDGKELAWINAIDESDPKLSFASGYPYLVRSVTLHEGKNRFEIKLDGERVWRATYVPKG